MCRPPAGELAGHVAVYGVLLSCSLMVCVCVWFDWLDGVCVGGRVCVWLGGWGVECCRGPQLVLPCPSTCVVMSLNLCWHQPNSPTQHPPNPPNHHSITHTNHPSSNKPPDRCEPQSSSTPPPFDRQPLPHLMPPQFYWSVKVPSSRLVLALVGADTDDLSPAQLEAACILASRRHLAAKARHARRAAARAARVFRRTLRACHRVREVYGTSSARW